MAGARQQGERRPCAIRASTPCGVAAATFGRESPPDGFASAFWRPRPASHAMRGSTSSVNSTKELWLSGASSR